MQQRLMPRAIAAGAVIAAAGLVLLTGPSHDELPPAVTGPRHAPIDVAATPQDRPPTRPVEETATERFRELDAMSETFRNTTFLIAIRDAGFLCNELRDVYGGDNEFMGWIVTCSEMLAYTVSVASGGALRVDPTLQYFDNLGPTTVPQERRDVPLPAQPPQEILPPPLQR